MSQKRDGGPGQSQGSEDATWPWSFVLCCFSKDDGDLALPTSNTKGKQGLRTELKTHLRETLHTHTHVSHFMLSQSFVWAEIEQGIACWNAKNCILFLYLQEGLTTARRPLAPKETQPRAPSHFSVPLPTNSGQEATGWQPWPTRSCSPSGCLLGMLRCMKASEI